MHPDVPVTRTDLTATAIISAGVISSVVTSLDAPAPPVLTPRELRAFVLFRAEALGYIGASAVWIFGLAAAVRRLERRYTRDLAYTKKHSPLIGTLKPTIGLEGGVYPILAAAAAAATTFGVKGEGASG